jgi:hypothetical protein
MAGVVKLPIQIDVNRPDTAGEKTRIESGCVHEYGNKKRR